MIKEDNTDYLNISIIKHNKDEFSNRVIKLAETLKISYLEAILEIVEEKKIEVEIVSKLITDELKQYIEKEAKLNKLLKNETNNNNL